MICVQCEGWMTGLVRCMKPWIESLQSDPAEKDNMQIAIVTYMHTCCVRHNKLVICRTDPILLELFDPVCLETALCNLTAFWYWS